MKLLFIWRFKISRFNIRFSIKKIRMRLSPIIILLSILQSILSLDNNNNSDALLLVSNKQAKLKFNESRRLLLTNENEIKNALFLEEFFFKLRDECPFDLNKYYGQSHAAYCPTKADLLFCYPTTPVNKTVRFKCPYQEFIPINDSKLFCKSFHKYFAQIKLLLNIAYAERVCQANGTWGPLRQKPCYDKIFAYICKMRNEATFFNLTRDRHFKLECVHDAGLNQFMTTFYLIGCSVTIVSVSVAIFIFISFR